MCWFPVNLFFSTKRTGRTGREEWDCFPPLLPQNNEACSDPFDGWKYAQLFIVIDGVSFIVHHYSFKIFRRFWLAPISRLILHNQLVLTIFGKCQQYAIDSMVYLLGNEVDRWYFAWKLGYLCNSELKKAVRGYQRRNSQISDYTWVKEMQEYAKNIVRLMLSTFWGLSARKNICLFLKLCQNFEEESLQGGKLVEQEKMMLRNILNK